MIPMSCPNCGSQGEVPLDRLNSRLKCRKCGTSFYMDETGSIMLGDPNDAKAQKRRRKAEAGPAFELDFNIGKMIQNTPKPVWIGGLVVVALAVLGFGVSALMASFSVPEDVEGRSEYVGELFVDNELDRLREFAVPGTADDLVAWHQAMRPQLNYEGPRTRRGDVTSSSALMKSGSSSAHAFVSLYVADAPLPDPNAKPDPDAPKNSITIPLLWSKQDGVWLIEGTKTLAEATKPKPEPLRSGSTGRR